MENILLLCQERYKFLEKPKEYIDNYIEKQKTDDFNKIKRDRYFLESKQHYNEYLLKIEKILKNKYRKIKDEMMEKLVEYLHPFYVYYKKEKIEVPSDFYLDFKTPDISGFLEYLEDEDNKRNIITEEDREKARLLNCNLDYNYLQELINKINKNPDLKINIKTKDGATITLFTDTSKQDLEDSFQYNEIILDKPMVK